MLSGQGGDRTGELLSNFSRYAVEGGVAPDMYLLQPTDNIHYAYHPCG